MVNIGQLIKEELEKQGGRQAGLPKSFTATALLYTEH